MKLLIMVHKLSGGGAERDAALWAQGFVERGHQVAILIKSLGAEAHYPVPNSIKLYGMLKGHETFKIKALYKIRATLKEFRPDCIIAVIQPMPLIARIASVGLNIPIISSDHGGFERPDYAKFGLIQNFYKFQANKLATIVKVLTEADKRAIGNRLKDVVVIPNPLAFPVATSPIKRQKIVMACGRIDVWHYKGFDLLLKAWNKIAIKHQDWSLKIVGGGKQKNFEMLKQLIDDRIANRVQFTGRLSNMASAYQEAEIFVLSSRYEAFGNVVMEAMSQGCACIACDYAGRQREIITSEDEGMTIPTDDVDALENSINRMIEDERYRMRCQHNGVERAKAYELPKIIDKWENVLKEL